MLPISSQEHDQTPSGQTLKVNWVLPHLHPHQKPSTGKSYTSASLSYFKIFSFILEGRHAIRVCKRGCHIILLCLILNYESADIDSSPPKSFLILYSQPGAMSKSTIHDPCYQQRLHGRPWSILPLEAMLMSLGHAAPRAHVDRHCLWFDLELRWFPVLCFVWGSCGCLSPVLP